MKIANIVLKSIENSPITFGRFYDVPKEDKESHADYEKSTWRERLHVLKDGTVVIPPMMIKNTLDATAKYLSVQIPGKGKATYTKHFDAGVSVYKPAVLRNGKPIKKDDVGGQWTHVPSDGMRGGTKRVPKCFPIIPEWTAECEVEVLDDTITEEVFEHHLREAGRFIGFGTFRPRNRGYHGRFEVVSIEWNNGDEDKKKKSRVRI